MPVPTKSAELTWIRNEGCTIELTLEDGTTVSYAIPHKDFRLRSEPGAPGVAISFLAIAVGDDSQTALDRLAEKSPNNA